MGYYIGSVAVAFCLLDLLSSIASTYGMKKTDFGQHLSPWPVDLACWIIACATTIIDLEYFWQPDYLHEVEDQRADARWGRGCGDGF